MLESVVLRDPALRVGERVGGSGMGLAVAERLGASVSPASPQPASSSAQQASPFDRRDLVEIRGNVRPLAPEASIALGAADEEGGGAPGSAGGKGGKGGSVLYRQVLAAYQSVGGFAAVLPAASPVRPSPAPRPSAPGEDRRARLIAKAFAAKEPESDLGRVLDLAA